MNKILCIIPARSGSKGLPGKNTKQFLDKPLIAWTIDAAKRSKYIDKIIVSTDDNHTKRISEEYGIYIIDRPQSLATDYASTIDVVIHSIEYLSEVENYVPEYVLLLQCTSPLRRVEHIDEAIESLINNRTNADSLISVTKEEHPPWWLRKVNSNGYLERFFDFDTKKHVRRQDFCELLRPNGAIYLTKTNLLLKNKSFQTNKTIPYIMDSVSSVDIDTKYDFMYAELIMRDKIRKN